MDLDDLWTMEGDELGDDPLDPSLDCGLEDDELGNIFGDIVGAVGKIAAAPVNLVASVLPKPIRKPFKAVSSLASPTALLDPGTRRTATGVISGALGGRKKSSSKRRKQIRSIMSAKAKGRLKKPKTVSLSSLAKGGTGRDALLETMVKVLGAKDIAKIAAQAKPRLSARSSGSTTQANALLVKMVTDAVAKKLDPTLGTINKRLALAENQRLATSEHNAINNQVAFRRKVLQDLMRISTCLPADNPTRQRIRRVGLMSGLL